LKYLKQTREREEEMMKKRAALMCDVKVMGDGEGEDEVSGRR